MRRLVLILLLGLPACREQGVDQERRRTVRIVDTVIVKRAIAGNTADVKLLAGLRSHIVSGEEPKP